MTHRFASNIIIHGQTTDLETRCVHYHGPTDIIAIKFKCCGNYYPCYECHETAVEHLAVRWPKEEWDTLAVLCGKCKHELTISEYLASANTCPNCNSGFNPNCSLHYHLYFEK